MSSKPKYRENLLTIILYLKGVNVSAHAYLHQGFTNTG